jgi:hypothetical protein
MQPHVTTFSMSPPKVVLRRQPGRPPLLLTVKEYRLIIEERLNFFYFLIGIIM